mgnify:CR=1 FL=1
MLFRSYRKRDEVKSGISQENGVQELIALLKADAVWYDAPEGTSTEEISPVQFSGRIQSSVSLIER